MLDINLIQSTSSWPFVEVRKLLKDRKELIKKKNKITITLVMQHLKMVVADQVEVLVVLVVQIFQIFLKIFLETLAVVEDQEIEDQIIEDQI